MNKKVTAIGLSAGLLAGLGAGLVLEMSGNAGASSNVAAVTTVTSDTSDTSGTSGDSSTGTAGTDTAGTPDADHAARIQEILQPLIDDGVLTQEQVDKVIAALEAAGPGGMHGGRGMGGPMFGRLDGVATLLGLTTDELRTELQAGSTLAAVAEAHGKTAQDVIDVLVQEVKDHFADEVASGEHTQDEADARIAEATTRITDMVNNGAPAGPDMGGPGMGGGRHGHGHDGDMDGDRDGGTDGDAGTSGTGGTIDGGPSDDATQTSADA